MDVLSGPQLSSCPEFHTFSVEENLLAAICEAGALKTKSQLYIAGRNIALKLAKAGKEWKAAAAVRMPEARGDIREIIGEPVFVPLQKLATIYGKASASCDFCQASHM